MEGRRPQLRVIRRPWYHWFRKLNKQTIVIIVVLVISVAIGGWNLTREERKSLATGKIKTSLIEHIATTEQKKLVAFLKNFNREISFLFYFLTYPHAHITYGVLFPFFLLFMLGLKNLKNFLKIVARSLGFIYRLNYTNYLVPCVLLLVLTLFIIVAYLYNIAFCMMCNGLVQHTLEFSVTEEKNGGYLIVDNRTTKIQQDVPPYFTINVTRYAMEDVVMTCRFIITCIREVPKILDSFSWVKDDGREIEETDRIRIATGAFLSKDDFSPRVFLIESKLIISFIDDADYGKYACKYARSTQEILQPDETISEFEDLGSSALYDNLIPYNPPEQTTKQCGQLSAEIFTIFYLRKQIMPLREIRIPPGGLFIEHVPYWSLADPGDIIINETVWSKDNSDCCWLPARLYMFFFGERDLVWRERFGYGRKRFLIRHQCVCVENFVIKNFTFQRNRYNATTKRQETFEIGLPQQFVPVPRSYKNEDVSQLLSDNFTKCANSGDTSPVCMRLKSMTDASQEAMLNHLFDLSYSHCAPHFIIVLLALCAYLRCFYSYVVTPVTNACMDPLLKTDPRQGYDYDMYMTYNETDRYERELVECLKGLLDRAACRVFDAWTDVLPGFPLLDERQKAIRKSRYFCIIISDDSVNDGEKILEFTAIKQTLADRKTAGTETEDCTFVIHIGDCDSDGFLIPGNVKLTENDKQNNEIDFSVLQMFSRWTKQRLDIKLNFLYFLRLHGFSITASVVTVAAGIVIAMYCMYWCWPIKISYGRSYIRESRSLYFVAE